MKKSQIISLFAAAAFAVAVPSAAFALDADVCGDQVPDALEQKAVDSANSADWLEGGAPSATSAATPSQEPVAASQAKSAGESAAGEATQGGSGEQGEQPSYSEGWNAVGSDWYFVRNGALVSGWEYINGHWYWFDSSAGCKMATGWIELSGSRYYLAQGGDFQGAMATGWLYDGGSWYYFSESSCAMQTGWIDVNGTWYYANASGRMETGWFASGDAWYWFDGNGAMATGWQWIDGSWYCFKSNGVWISDSMNAKAQSYASRTNWLILVDTSRCVTSIYYGSQGNWDLNRRYVCSTGRAGTPTVIGEYEVFGKGYSFGHGYTCYYYTQFYGDYLFHSSPYYVNSNRIMDPTMGVPSSAGCVRLEIQNAKWIYDNIPYGTKVVTYN